MKEDVREHTEADFQRLLAEERLILAASELIHGLMQMDGVSRAELARRIGKSKGHVSQVLDGKRNMTLRTLAQLTHVLGHDVRLATEALEETPETRVPVYATSLDARFAELRHQVVLADAGFSWTELLKPSSVTVVQRTEDIEDVNQIDVVVRAA